jgi:hypothetical protein
MRAQSSWHEYDNDIRRMAHKGAPAVAKFLSVPEFPITPNAVRSRAHRIGVRLLMRPYLEPRKTKKKAA